MRTSSGCAQWLDDARELAKKACRLLFPAVFAVMLLAACGQAAAHSTRSATRTPAPAHTLAWSSVNVPQAMQLTPDDPPSVAIAPSDGNTAYICPSPYTTARQQVWVTHDRGAHWTSGSDVPAAHSGGCMLVVDATNPNMLIATVGWYNLGEGPNQGHTLSYLSRDGARTWTALGAQQTFGELATYGGTTYALRNVGEPGAGGDLSLDASRDGLRTWHTVDAAAQSMSAFWLNPTNGALLVQAYNEAAPWSALWQSSDGGAHWSALSTLNISADKVVVQSPTSGQPWHLCAQAGATGSITDGSAPIACSLDGGHTWQFPPVTDSPTFMTIAAITPDGSLLGALNDMPDTDQPAASLVGLFRLPPGSDTWQPLGGLPNSGLGSANILLAGGDVLWLVAVSGGLTAAAAGYTGNLSTCYTASYS